MMRNMAFVGLMMICMLAVGAGRVMAAPYAAMVIDARTGEVLHARNADTRLHPASLTKMMTLYIAFEAIRLGEISLDTDVQISRNAAAEPPSKLGLRAGQKIKLRYLIRAAAIKSANDAATAIGEAIEGSEAAFARRMTRTANALGMTRTTFRNAHGLTVEGHLSTARDMTTMGRRLFYDYPQYYNLFSRKTADTGVRQVSNTNIRLLNSYRGADGIKTGYTRAAGFNLVASAERGQERVIATVFGGQSTATRNARIEELLDLGFNRAPSRVAARKPSLPEYQASPAVTEAPGVAMLTSSLRPVVRPRGPDVTDPAPTETLLMASASSAGAAVTVVPSSDPGTLAPAAALVPPPRPSSNPLDTPTQSALAALAPLPRPSVLLFQDTDAVPREIVTRASSSNGKVYGIALQLQPTRSDADKLLLQTALQELDTLDTALRQVKKDRRGFLPSFVGLTERDALRACTRLLARKVHCEVREG
jgi:D-alanyl-D-alanine carboxypeptidase